MRGIWKHNEERVHDLNAMSLARERGLNGAKRWSKWRGLGNSLIESGLGEIVYFEQVGWFRLRMFRVR